MMIMLIAELLVAAPAAAAPLSSAANIAAAPALYTADGCLEPAIPLPQLALAYDRWPAPSRGDAKAYEALQKFMRSHRSADHGSALNAYNWANGDQEDSTIPHVQLAMSLLNITGPYFDFDGPDGYRFARSRYNTNAERVAARLLERMLTNDSSQWLAAVALTRLAIASRGEDRMKQAEWTVQRVLAADPDLVAARLARYDLLIAQGKYQDAVAYMKTFTSQCAAVEHARAESLMLAGDTASGARIYLAALKNAAPDQLARFYEDVLVMASRQQLAEYEEVPAARKPKWLLTFWDRNAAEFGRSLETRIAEQTVRAAFANANFKRDRVQTVAGAGAFTAGGGIMDARPTRVAPTNPLRSNPTIFLDDFIADSSQAYPWDIRGVLYMRHGAPLHRMELTEACNGMEVWVYVAETDSFVLEFRRECGPHDWKVKRTPTCGPPASGAEGGMRTINNTLGKDPDPAVSLAKARANARDMDVREMYQVAARYDTRYAKIVGYCNIVSAGGPVPIELPRLQQEISLERQKLVASLEWNNSAHRQFFNPLRMGMATYRFQSSDRSPEIAVLSWIRAGDLLALPGNAISLQYAYAFLPTAGEPVRVQQTKALPENIPADGVIESVYMWKPGAVTQATIHLLAMTPADTSYGGSRTARIEVSAAQGHLAISDIVLAVSGEEGVLKRGAASVAPLPFHTIGSSETFRLFFEIYGLQPGEEYKTEVRIRRTHREGVSQLRRLFPGKQEERSITTTATAQPDARGVSTYDVDIANDLLPGTYSIEVKSSGKRGSTSTKGSVQITV